MKKIILVILLALITLVIGLGLPVNASQTVVDSDILRIHIRANSNDVCDQQIKYEIKNEIVNYLIPLLKDIENKQDVENIVLANKRNIENLVDNFLKENGFNYTSNIKLANEEFPTRSYNGVVFESGFYDAVIVELGEAQGNNWWCVIYPPICFTEYSNKNATQVVYKSKIMEIIDKILKRS